MGLCFPYGLRFLHGLEARDDGLVARSRLPHLHTDFGVDRQIDVHAAAELDEAQVLVDVAVLAILA